MEPRTKHYEPDEVFIVKAQLDSSGKRALIYDLHRIIKVEFVLIEDDPLLEIMKGRDKAFFYADVSATGELNFDTESNGEPPWQEW